MAAHSTHQPFGSAAFARAAAEQPGIHPVRAALASMGTGKNQEAPADTLKRLRQRLADMLSFGVSSPVRIADIKAQIAQIEARLDSVSAQLDEVEASFERCVEHAATVAFARKIAAA